MHEHTQSQVYRPWRRYFARQFDITIYGTIWSIILALVFGTNLLARGLGWLSFLDTMATFLLMLLIEPLWLHFFGTTPGKALFGLRLETHRGERLTYMDGFERTWGVIGGGFGYGIPIYHVVRLWKSYKSCSAKEQQSWDYFISYSLKDTSPRRTAIFIGAYAAISALSILPAFVQMLPPNRGDITVAQFVENVNYYANYLDIDFGGQYLHESGRWMEDRRDDVFYFPVVQRNRKAAYQFDVRDGYVQGVSFEIDERHKLDQGDMPVGISYGDQLVLTTLAFLRAQDGAGLFSLPPQIMAARIRNNASQSYGFREAGVLIVWDIEYDGYFNWDSGVVYPAWDVDEMYFWLRFSATKEDSQR